LNAKVNNLEKNESSLVSHNKKMKDKMYESNKVTDNLIQEKEGLILSLSQKIREKDLVIKALKKSGTNLDINTNVNANVNKPDIDFSE